MDKTPSFIVQPFGNYILLDRLAVGGMAEIYKARQSGARGFEKIVVIKKILQHLREDPEFVEMFEDEAKIASQLNQANIVQIYELGEVDEVLYITMEYVEGKNLRDVTRHLQNKSLHLSIEQCLFIITEVLKGLDYAHRKTNSLGQPLEIVHRDMSPQNIVVSYEGEVKILDFGIAKAASRVSRTEAGVLKGKFSYMSPEQASGRPIDQTTDIYAVGVILHELLTSERLFRAESDVQTLERVKAGFVPPPSEKNPQVPEALDKIVLKALAREPENRYTSASAFLSDLSQLVIEKKLNLSAQELAAFMHSLFESLIHEERSRLQAALQQASDPLLKSQSPGNTHIAFKADKPEGSASADRDGDDEITVSTYPEKRKKKIAFWILGGIFVAAGFVGAFVFEQSPPPPEPRQVPSEVERAQDPAVEEETAASDSSPGDSVDPEEPTSPVEDPPETERPPATVEEPEEGSHLGRIFTRREEQTPAEEEPAPEILESEAHPLAPKNGRMNLIAPPEGFAQVFIDDRLIGSVPGPRARGIELPAGEYELRCDTPNRSYRGRVAIEGDRTRDIRCQDLREDEVL